MNHLGKLGSFLIVFISITGCDSLRNEPEGQRVLPFEGAPFDVLLEDVDGNGKQDITAIDHAGNFGQSFLQLTPRSFSPGSPFREVGFHPGNLLRFPGESLRYVASAEGSNTLLGLEYTPTGFKVVSSRPESAPRFASTFQWPEWGNSLAIAPFNQDYIVLLKQYDPASGKAAERVEVPLAEHHPSVRNPNKLTIADIDGDTIPEILMAMPVTNELLAVSFPKPGVPVGYSVIEQNDAWGMPDEVVAIDMDQDGDNDLLLADETTPGKINVLINDGHGHFKQMGVIDFPNDHGITALTQGIDHDNSRYLLAAGRGALVLFRIPEHWQPGQNLAHVSLDLPVTESANSLQLKDVDGDGWLDAVLARSLYKNSLWIVYGSLWQRLPALAAEKFTFRQ
jgi:hypothetical protein